MNQELYYNHLCAAIVAGFVMGVWFCAGAIELGRRLFRHSTGEKEGK